MDLVAERFEDHRWFCILTLIDTHTREALLIRRKPPISGEKVAQYLNRFCEKRKILRLIRVDNGWVPRTLATTCEAILQQGDRQLGISIRSDAQLYPAGQNHPKRLH